MTRFLKKMSKKIGIIPGSLIHIGEKKVKNTKITFIDYDKDKCTQGDLQVISDISPFTEKPTVTWINVIGLHNPDIIAEIGKLFQIHPLPT